MSGLRILVAGRTGQVAESLLEAAHGDGEVELVALGRPDLDDAEFQRLAEDAKQNCPVSKALAGVDIHLDASLTG